MFHETIFKCVQILTFNHVQSSNSHEKYATFNISYASSTFNADHEYALNDHPKSTLSVALIVVHFLTVWKETYETYQFGYLHDYNRVSVKFPLRLVAFEISNSVLEGFFHCGDIWNTV